MANHKSALKRIRQTEKRRIANRTIRNRARTFVTKAKNAQNAGAVGLNTGLDYQPGANSDTRELIELQHKATGQPVVVVPVAISSGRLTSETLPRDLAGLPIVYNGAALLGLRGLVFKSHGSADEFAFEQALNRAYDAARNNLLERVQARIAHARPLLVGNEGDAQSMEVVAS